MQDYIHWIGDTSGDQEVPVGLVGGKGHGLHRLTRLGLRVPEAFTITTQAYRSAIQGSLDTELRRRVEALAGEKDMAALDEATAEIRLLVAEGTADCSAERDIRDAFARLSETVGQEDLAVAVRSSSAAEDSADRSFAGEHDTYLWVLGADEVCAQVRNCWASLFTTRAVAYRSGGAAQAVTEDVMAVVVQRMVDARAAGVMMTLNPVNGDRSKVAIEALWGLGEPLVSGMATPDRFVVDKVTREVVVRDLAKKTERLERERSSGRGTTGVPVADIDQEASSLTEDQLTALVETGRAIERAAGKPQDVEFATDGTGPENVYLLQARPETVWSNRRSTSITSGKASALGHVLDTLTRPSSG